MPLVEIHLNQTRPAHTGALVGEAVHQALIDALAIPAQDHFQIIRAADALVYDESFLGVRRGAGFLVIQIFLARGRSVEQKQALYRRIAELLSERCAIRAEDVFVNLVEVGTEDFSFGCGLAQYAETIPPHLTASRSE